MVNCEWYIQTTLLLSGIIDGVQNLVRGLILALGVEEHEVVVGATLGTDVKRANGHQVDCVLVRLSDGIEWNFVIVYAARASAALCPFVIDHPIPNS